MYRVEFSPDARRDLNRLYDYIAERASADVAFAYIERIEAACASLESFPLRGTRRDDLFPDLRIIGFERRVSIAFRVVGDRVTIDRVLYGGRELHLSASMPTPE